MPIRRRPSARWWSLDENGGPGQSPSIRTVSAQDLVNTIRPVTMPPMSMGVEWPTVINPD
jgi:hypothetical protein